jgi:hypothetical protein
MTPFYRVVVHNGNVLVRWRDFVFKSCNVPKLNNRYSRKPTKLTAEQVITIRKVWTGKYGQQTSLSREYHVTDSTIHDIVKRLSWKHI